MPMLLVQLINIDIWTAKDKRNTSPLYDVQLFKQNFCNNILYPATEFTDKIIFQNMCKNLKGSIRCPNSNYKKEK